MCFILVRTEPDAKKHEGISYILLPMDTPGIEVQPLRTMSGDIGENSFNQVFFSDVRVPKANVVGPARRRLEDRQHHTQARAQLAQRERRGHVLMRLARLMQKETSERRFAMASPVYRDRLMKLQARVLSMKHHGMRMLTCSLKGESPGVAGLIVKLQNCQLNFDMAALALDVMGELGALYDHAKYEREQGYWQAHSMFSLGLIIGGGTAQIQKNIIAERGLGMLGSAPRTGSRPGPEPGERGSRHGLRTFGRPATARPDRARLSRGAGPDRARARAARKDCPNDRAIWSALAELGESRRRAGAEKRRAGAASRCSTRRSSRRRSATRRPRRPSSPRR